MAADNVDAKIKIVKEMINLWSELQKELDEALENPEVTQQMEDKCMTLKTKIAQRSQYSKEAIKEYGCAGSVRKVLLGMPTLDLFKNHSPIVVSNLRNVWHDAYIAMNQLQGNLMIQKQEQAKGGGASSKSKGSFFSKKK